MLRLTLVVSAVLFECAAAMASGITYNRDKQIWLLTDQQMSYAIGVAPNGAVENLHWGGQIPRIEDLEGARNDRGISSFDPGEMRDREEYPGWGGRGFEEPALKVTRPDGNRDLVLRYQSYREAGDTLEITLKDIKDEISVVLHYRLHPETDVLERWSTIRNGTGQPLILESAQSATWLPPIGTGYRLTYLSGRWAAETQVNQEPIHEGLKVLESRLGHTGHNLNPWFAMDSGTANENSGGIWFGALAWSGNWRMTVEQTPYRQVRVTAGFNSFDFSYPLKPGQTLETPSFFGGFTRGGFGAASRQMHRLERRDIAPGGEKSRLRPVLYNSWEATEFAVNEQGQRELAEKAAKLGVELFVMDDGWFGKRNNDRAGLGDWFVNKDKFPNGLQPLIRHVNELGMEFGLWFEPEMVNPDSDLYRAHPDWVINFPGRPRSELRNQLVLNVAREDVRDYLLDRLDKMVSDNNIRYIKWDMNRIFSEPGWPEAGPDEQKTLWVHYVRNLYSIMDQLRARHPKLEIESCSGGGGRVDLGILTRVEEFWTSDNTEAFDRLRIQEGFSEAYAAKFMSAWVTDVPNMNGRSVPLQFRFLVAMQGALGIGANLNKWTGAEMQSATKLVTVDKQIRATVQQGDLYRLLSPHENDVTANEYVGDERKQAVLFAFRHSQQYGTEPPILYWQGLEGAALYRVRAFDGSLPETIKSGAFLMEHGTQLHLKGDYDSMLLIADRQ